MRNHRAKELDLKQEVVKHKEMVAALRQGQAIQAAQTLRLIANGFEGQVRSESPTAKPGGSKKMAQNKKAK
jgi:hypothetical protein